MLAVNPVDGFDKGPFADVVIHALSDDKSSYESITLAGHTTEPPQQPANLALVFLGRNRVANHAEIAMAMRRLAPGGILLVDGQKTDGIDSVLKQMRTHFEVAGVLSKSHGKVFWLVRPEYLPDVLEDWENLASPQVNSDGLITAPGMFSHEGIDPGTAFLAENLPQKCTGRAADLGAGWGALSLLLLNSAPGITTLHLYEADRKALDAARENLQDPRASFHWSDVTSLKAQAQPYDLVISNPPFHTTRKAEPSLGIAFIEAAARILSPKGVFLMVANRHLPYEAALDVSFRSWSETANNARYKVITATAPRTRT
ncbi:class I SAM-dependent methyltransferase [Algicella marina]|uniref:Methyltransferase n=1 Tax=Algicella marina TaxID=2683284 RepID=A0A6P1SW72_9RHOB|nr:class I SAM-dependent methyltransferase [Algicella marina]QHQ33785.1 methyltransferase [Algicella marina]